MFVKWQYRKDSFQRRFSRCRMQICGYLQTESYVWIKVTKCILILATNFTSGMKESYIQN